MKKLFTLLATVTLSVMLFAQAPQSFSYQTVIRDASWQVLSNQNISLEISIIEDVANGTAIYTESHSATTNELGLVNLSIGQGGVMQGNWTNIDWGNHTYFIEVAVDVTGGTSYIVMGTTQLRSVPYALYAETSGSMLPGPQGLQGIQGLPGDTGATGAQGPIGLTGPAGTNGIDGTNGVDGNDGAAGVDGTNGVDGNDGAVGAQGPIGLTGPAGNDGADGNDGAVGATGPPGNDGADGVDGVDGSQGIQGLPGNDGQDGTNGVDGTNGADGNDGIDAVVDYDSLANLISIDSSFTANVSSGISSGGCDFLYPEGFNGEAIIAQFNYNTFYTVPNGKRLYLTGGYGNLGMWVNGIPISGNPLIANPGDVFSNQSNSFSYINGFLVPIISGIDGVLAQFNYNTFYTVPNGKRLYITGGYGNLGMWVNGIPISGNPLIANPGDVFSNQSNSFSYINGYLADENYFAGCGGGGSSSATSNATIDSLSQVVSHLDSSLTALTSLLTFGCTDASALNYDPIANTDNGLCTYAPLAIGNFYQGGIIFYLDGNGGGLVCLVNDINIDLEWGCSGYPMPGADGTAIGTGFQNTIDIVNANCSFGGNGIGIAANICENLTHEGYSDWFLPSKDELNQMFINKDIINLGSGIAFGSILGYTYYWSSTEGDDFNACLQDFTNGNQYCNAGTKYGVNGVRAIRAF